MIRDLSAFWSIPPGELLKLLDTKQKGLGEGEAQQRLKLHGANLLKARKKSYPILLLLSQFKSPIILLLVFAACLSLYLHQVADASIILVIILISGLLGFWQERSAADAIARLLEIVQIKAAVLRGGTQKEVPVEEVVPGDIILLRAGDIVPGDSLILQSRDLFANEATLTGETYPVEKTPGVLDRATLLSQRVNGLFMGTNVVSETAKAVVVHTGADTEFGFVSSRLKFKEPETEFEHGIKRFGYLFLEVTMVLVVAIFAINVYLARPVVDSFLFSLALAVGLTPQLLPAIISINLAHGARRMAAHKVIVKRLASIENFGSMNVLCTER